MTPLSIIIRHDSCKIQNFSSVPGFRAPTYLDRIIANPALKSSRAGSMAVPWERQASAWTSWEASDGDGVVRTRVLSWVTRRGGEVRLRHPLCSAAASRYCALEKHSRKAGPGTAAAALLGNDKERLQQRRRRYHVLGTEVRWTARSWLGG